MLGWDVDAAGLTLNLPPHHLARCREVLSWLSPPRRRLSVAKWHQLLGELRSMSPALPGTRGLFSVLQEALSRGDRTRVRLNQHVYDTAADFTYLLDSLASRPTRLSELVPTPPKAVGASDACQRGMGGVWLDAHSQLPQLVWRQEFPSHVSAALVSDRNPSGSLSISDLELSAIIAHKDILARSRDVRERTIWIASDNQAAVSWSQKGSSTSVAARAYLLRFNALHQRCHLYLSRHHYIPGPVNAMADDASRRWDLTDADFLAHFDSSYPQALSWQVCRLSSATNASLTGALCRKRPCNALLASAAPTPTPVGSYGTLSAPASALIPSSWNLATASPSSKCTPSAIAPAQSPPAATLCELAHGGGRRTSGGPGVHPGGVP